MALSDTWTKAKRSADLGILNLRLKLLEPRMALEPSKAMLLFASPRGGSTWLEQILALVPRTMTIWEPLDIARNPAFGRIGFHWRQHIPDDVQWPEAEALFQRMLRGRMLSPYLTQSNSYATVANSERALVKFVRGNLLLPWAARTLGTLKPVLLVRHPCAVVSSMLTFGAWDDLTASPPMAPPHRYDALLRHYLTLTSEVRTIEERLAAIWCLSNAYALTHPLNGIAWTTVTYEELLLHTTPTLERIFSPWGIPVPSPALELARTPSRTTRSGSSTDDPMDQLALWERKLTKVQQDRILDMVARFGIDLYSRDMLPKGVTAP